MEQEERHKWNRDERELLQSLDAILKVSSVRKTIDAIAAKLKSGKPEILMAKEPVPLALYGDQLPHVIRASWVYLMRSPAVTGAERHPNSHQRTASYNGTGYFEVNESPEFDGESEGASYMLVSGTDEPLESRWVSIPVDLWHQAVAHDGDWIVVSFHTAAAAELIEERPGRADSKVTA
jgi:hypothetical protein